MEEEYKEYKEYIKSLALLNKNVVFFNSGPDHATFVLTTIFENAKNDLKIYAGDFAGKVSSKSEYKNSLEKYLKKGGTLKILLQKDKLDTQLDTKNEPEIFSLLRFYNFLKPNQISIKTHHHQVTKKNSDGIAEELHFTIADNKMYRVENDILNFKATCNFNDPIITPKLSILFDQIFDESSSIAFPL